MKKLAGTAFFVAALLIAGRIDYEDATKHHCDASTPKAVLITHCPTELGYK